MIRKRYVWKVRDREIQLGDRTLIMGIVNVTPDSFSDGGKYFDPDAAAARALELQDLGADIIDIGAESTRPGSGRVSEGEELRRLIPVLKRLKGRLDVPISVDTYKPGVASVALENGAAIINDPSGLTWEPELAKVAMQYNSGLILNHTRGTPETWAKHPPMHDVAGTIRSELDAAVSRARHAGVERDRIVIDPGLGFGKRREQNSEMLARLRELEQLTLPVLVGPSRKSFLARANERETEFASAAAATACILHGAHMLRVHDVAATRAAIAVADAIAAIPPREADHDRDAEKRRRQAQKEERLRHAPDLDDESRRRPVRPPAERPAAPDRAPAPPPEQRPDNRKEFRQPGPPPFRGGEGDRRSGPPRPGGSSRPGGPPRPGGPSRPGGPPRPGGPSRPGGPQKFGRPPRPGGPSRSGGPPKPGGSRPGGNRPPRPPRRPDR